MTLTESPSATVHLTRLTQFQDWLRAYRIVVDDAEVARLKAGETIEFEIPAGNHVMVAKIDWARSNYLQIAAAEGDHIDIECGNNFNGFWKNVIMVFWVIFQPHKYLYLRRAEE